MSVLKSIGQPGMRYQLVRRELRTPVARNLL
jgi:hypothetical protein